MAVLTSAQIVTEVRVRVGDNDSANYLADATAFASFVVAANRKLAKYVKKEAEDTSTTGTGVSSYALPSTIYENAIQSVRIRTGTDVTTDREQLGTYQIHHRTLFLQVNVGTSEKVVYWYYAPYTLGTDDIPDYVAEVMYKLVEREWISYAMNKRADFEQWAATNRSDTRISELRSLRRDIDDDLNTISEEFGSRLEVTDVWGGI